MKSFLVVMGLFVIILLAGVFFGVAPTHDYPEKTIVEDPLRATRSATLSDSGVLMLWLENVGGPLRVTPVVSGDGSCPDPLVLNITSTSSGKLLTPDQVIMPDQMVTISVLCPTFTEKRFATTLTFEVVDLDTGLTRFVDGRVVMIKR